MLQKIWFPSSSTFTLSLIVLGALAAVQSPFSALSVVSLDTKAGTYIYLVALVVLGVGYILAEKREKAARKREQEERDESWRIEQENRDAASERQYVDGLAAAFSNQSADIKATVEFQYAKWRSDTERRDALLASGVPPTSPQVQELTESARSSAVTIAGVIAMSGTGTVTVTGHAPEVTISESKAPLFMPRVSSSGKPPS